MRKLKKLLSERGVSNCQRCPALPGPHTIQQSFHRTLKGSDYILEMLKVFQPLGQMENSVSNTIFRSQINWKTGFFAFFFLTAKVNA